MNANGQSTTPTTVPMLPTATAYVPPAGSSGMYSNPEAGISLKIPSSVKIDTSDSTGGTYASLVLGDNEVFGVLFGSSAPAGQSLEEIAHTIRDQNLSDVSNIKVVEDKQIQINNGKEAWYTIADGTLTKYNQQIRSSLVTVIGYSNAVTLMFYTIPDNFKYYQTTLDGMNNSLTVSAPVISGFPRDQVLLLEGGESSNPIENDPATEHSSGDSLVFSGLVSYDPNLNLIPDLAASWDISPDGTVYTFHIQPKAIFHNGRPVTADDIVYSWERAADPKTKSDTAITYLGDIVGVREMHTGQAGHISGLKVIDDHTLQVTIDSSKPYFLLKLTYPTAFVVDHDNISQGEKWYMTPNGTGPYKLVRWESMKEMIYERFDAFYGPKPRIPAIVVQLYTGSGTRLYESGSIDMAGVGSYDVDRFLDPSEPLHTQLHSAVTLCTSYITLDVTQPPFDDLKVRQAFALALDKNKFIQVVMNDAALPAKGLYPPALPGFNQNLKGWDYDPEKARQLLSESKYANQMPEITFTASGYGSDVSSDVAAWIQMWKQNLGITINVQNIEPERYMQVLTSQKHGQLISQGWCADYPDPQNFADILFHTNNDMNYGHYTNPKVDALLEQARTETDVAKRIQLYQDAEQIIVDEVPAIFVDYNLSYTLVKPFIQGYTGTPMTIPLERYLWIDPTKLSGN
jgi:oligopeptide transport system substrate-binding protein